LIKPAQYLPSNKPSLKLLTTSVVFDQWEDRNYFGCLSPVVGYPSQQNKNSCGCSEHTFTESGTCDTYGYYDSHKYLVDHRYRRSMISDYRLYSSDQCS